jgi:hypothetical protein
MEKHTYSISEWVFSEDTCSFSIRFSVASQGSEDCKFYTMSVPYALEDPLVFRQKLHNSMVLFVNNLRYLEDTKSMLENFTFVDYARTTVANSIEEKNSNE